MITIVLVDDHKLVRQGLKLLLEDEPDIKVVGEAANGPDGIELVETLKPDILITDLVLDGMNGIEVTKEIRTQIPGIKIIVLTMYNDAGYVRHALKEGARGYILKGAGIEDLVQAVRTVMAGGSYLSPSVIDKSK